MKRTTIVILLCACMLLSACQKDGEGDIRKAEQQEEPAKEAVTEETAGKVTAGEGEEERAAGKTSGAKEGEKGTGEETEEEDGKSVEMEWVREDQTTYIPETLLRFLGEQMSLENEEIIVNLKPLTIDDVLETDELAAYRNSADVEKCIERIEQDRGIFLLVDGDNDGREDLFAWIDDGGSMGNNSRVFLQGQKDGSFRKTDEREDITQELLFIAFEGKNYLLETTYDYYKNAVDGFKVSCYVDGVCRETAYVFVENTHYEWETVVLDEKYRSLADKIIQMGETGFRKDYSYDWLLDVGNGERSAKLPENLKAVSKRENGYCSDLNNDGKDEWYTKSIFYPSSLYAYMCIGDDSLYLDGEPERESLLSYYNLEYEGTPLIFWVEHVEKTDRQIVCLLSYDGLSRDIVSGFLIEGKKVTKVLEIDFRGNEEIAYDIFSYKEVS